MAGLGIAGAFEGLGGLGIAEAEGGSFPEGAGASWTGDEAAVSLGQRRSVASISAFTWPVHRPCHRQGFLPLSQLLALWCPRTRPPRAAAGEGGSGACAKVRRRMLITSAPTERSTTPSPTPALRPSKDRGLPPPPPFAPFAFSSGPWLRVRRRRSNTSLTAMAIWMEVFL